MATVDALADDLAALARSLRDAGDEGLRREVTSAIRRAAGTIPPAIRAGMADRHPRRYFDGTLRADTQIGVRVQAGTSGTVSVYARTRGTPRHQRKLRRLDEGFLTHPLFGDRDHQWYTQAVTPGWFTQPAGDAQPRVRREIEDALDRVKDQIWAGVHR